MTDQRRSSEVRYELVWYQGREARRVLLPASGSALIGRSGYCEVRIENTSVSRRHAVIHLNELQVEDLDSRNGSWLFVDAGSWNNVAEASPDSGQRLEPGRRVALRPGDYLKLGSAIAGLNVSAQALRTAPVPDEGSLAQGEVVLLAEAMRALYELAERAAASSLPVLISGETGVGKDVLAVHIHRSSLRASGPFVRINCGALTDSLLESELFGHQRGAFTGASEAKPGLLELGDKGTCFLDEIGELPLRTQVKLLHVLETGEVMRVGGTHGRHIDVRYLAATNRDLAQDVRSGRFRRDLFFRINAVCMEVPPLRQRSTEIVTLARHFVARFCAKGGIAEPGFTPEALAQLVKHSWPGNLRELRNAVERAVIVCRGPKISPEDLPAAQNFMSMQPAVDELESWETPTNVGSREQEEHLSEDQRIVAALELCRGNQTRAAQVLGISRRTLVNRLNRYQLPRPRKRESKDGR